MIRITVEIVPYGIEDSKKVIGIAKIWNDLTGAKTTGNYKYKVSGKKNKLLRNGDGRITGFKRKKENVWKLIYLVLKDIYK